MKNIKFTVIGTSFNDAKIILNYFTSIMQQTFQPVEYILVDGGSTDNTVEMVKEFAEKENAPIRVISGQRLNIAQGYNVGIKEAKTDIIIITGLGNKYESTFFEELIKEYSSGDNKVVYGPIVGQDNNFFSYVYNRAYLRGKEGWRSWVPSNRGVLIEKSVFEQIGYFYEKFVYAGEDSEFFKRVMNNGIPVGYTKKARLYWETPKSMKEHIKKKNGYYIGGMQHSGHKKDLMLAYGVLACSALGIVFCKTIWPYIALIAAYIMMSLRIHSFNPLAFLLRVFDMILPIYLQFKNRKYSDASYKVGD